MKQLTIKIAIATFLLFAAMPTQQCSAQVPIIGSILSKVIKAIDIAVQKVQNQTLQLQNEQRVIEDAMSKLKLDQITDWATKEKSLFSDYYDALAKVKAVISTYRQIKEIINIQADMVGQYKEAYNLFKNDPHFTPGEISYMYNVYTGLIDKSLENIDELMMIANSFETKMTDGKRLELINDVTSKMQKVRVDLLEFNRQNMQVSLNRSTSQSDADAVKKYYGLK